MEAGVEVVQTLSSFLPRRSVVSTRPDIAGMNSTIFKEFAKWFVEQVHDLTAGCRKVILLYNDYRCHMNIQALDTFASGRVIAYALPAHTSGTTQPFYVAVFRPFKLCLNDTRSRCSRSARGALYDEFDFCGIMRMAHLHAFTPDTMRSAFANTDIWPFTPEVELRKTMPASADDVSTMASVQDLNRILEQKRVEEVAGAAVGGTVLRQGPWTPLAASV
jgi:DDE superfamily endonuclease